MKERAAGEACARRHGMRITQRHGAVVRLFTADPGTSARGRWIAERTET
jgi:hypothetical protein